MKRIARRDLLRNTSHLRDQRSRRRRRVRADFHLPNPAAAARQVARLDEIAHLAARCMACGGSRSKQPEMSTSGITRSCHAHGLWTIPLTFLQRLWTTDRHF